MAGVTATVLAGTAILGTLASAGISYYGQQQQAASAQRLANYNYQVQLQNMQMQAQMQKQAHAHAYTWRHFCIQGKCS